MSLLSTCEWYIFFLTMSVWRDGDGGCCRHTQSCQLCLWGDLWLHALPTGSVHQVSRSHRNIVIVTFMNPWTMKMRCWLYLLIEDNGLCYFVVTNAGTTLTSLNDSAGFVIVLQYLEVFISGKYLFTWTFFFQQTQTRHFDTISKTLMSLKW